MTITVYTDGACKVNTRLGAWAFTIEDETQSLHAANRVSNTTNQRMELTAAIKSLESLHKHKGIGITIYSDSEYLVNGMTEWLANWKRKGWSKANNKPVDNVDLWRRLDELAGEHAVTWRWVKGHSGNAGNELADRLANRAMAEGKIIERSEVTGGLAA